MLFNFRGGLFTPRDIPNLLGWYDASDASTITIATGVSQWNDKSGNGNHVTQATTTKQPAWNSLTLNGLPVISPDGTDDHLTLPAGIYTDLPNGESTVFFVARQDAVAQQRLMTIATAGNSTRYTVRYSSSSSAVLLANNSTGTTVGTTAGFVNTDWNIICARHSGTTQAISPNDATEATNTSATNQTSTTKGNFFISGDGAADPLAGDCAEIIIYNRSLSSTERRRVAEYLSYKWGVMIKGTLNRPDNFDLTIPFTISYDGYVYTTNISSASYKITPTLTYYVTTTGNNSNDGLTVGNAKRSIDGAITAGNTAGVPYEIQVSAGTYYRNNTWTITPTQNCNIIGSGTVIVSSEWETKTGWTSSGGGTAYKITRSNCLGVADSLAGVLDANGDYRKLTLAASQAACESTTGTWYTDNVTVWVNTSDGRDLSADGSAVKLYLLTGYPTVVGGYQVYCEGLQFEGGYSGAFFAEITSSSQVQTLYFKSCKFNYSTQNSGLRAQGTTLVICESCTAAKNYGDGFNYHIDSTVASNAIEISCSGRSNGVTGNISDNGSSMHDGGRALRINGSYFSNNGRNIHDIGDSKSWNISCNSYNSADGTDSGSINFMCSDGTPGDESRMWLTRCSSSGSNKDLRVEDDGIIYVSAGSNLINKTNTIDPAGTITYFKSTTS